MTGVVVAIDGPAGSGKSSVSRAVASRLGLDYLDTGAAYRALTWLALERGVDPHDELAVVALVGELGYVTIPGPDGARILVGDADVTSAIREPRVTAVVSDLARIPSVRTRLNDMFRQRIAGASAGVVVEGRDITTIVAPDADVRILLTADEDVRVARRTAELAVDAAASAGHLRERDRRDSTVVDFLSAAPGVVTVDSTDLGFEETVQRVIELVEARDER